MNGICKWIVLLNTSVLVAGAAPGPDQPDKSASFDQGKPLTSTAKITLDLKREPQLVLGNSTRITGLIVDGLAPQKAWVMLNPTVSSPDLQRTGLRSKPAEVKAARIFNDNLAVHEPDLAFLRLSFPYRAICHCGRRRPLVCLGMMFCYPCGWPTLMPCFRQ